MFLMMALFRSVMYLAHYPVLTIQDPLAAAGAVVIACRPPLLPVSMDIRGVDLLAGRLPAMSAAMDGLLPGRRPLSNGGGGLIGTHLSGAWCDSFGGPPGTDLEDECPTPVGSPLVAVDECMPLSDVGRGRGSGACSLGGGGLAGDGDAHCRPCCGVFPDPGDISCSPGSHDVVRELSSTGGGCSCWSGSGESGSERDPVAPGFPACLGDFLWTTPVFVGVASHTGCRSTI